MENVAGGSPAPLPPKAGYKCCRITSTDRIIRIAERFLTTVDALLHVNTQWIRNRYLLRTRYDMYVPE